MSRLDRPLLMEAEMMNWRNAERSRQLSSCTSMWMVCGEAEATTKKLKCLDTTLTGALRRDKMAETTIKQLEVEIEQLNRLVRQREEDTRCTKMMLKFREEKIQRMEILRGG